MLTPGASDIAFCQSHAQAVCTMQGKLAEHRYCSKDLDADQFFNTFCWHKLGKPYQLKACYAATRGRDSPMMQGHALDIA